MNELLNTYLANVLDELATLGVVLTANIILVSLALLWIGFNALVKTSADRFYARLEERKAQRDWDKWLTDHEERYYKK